MVDVVYWLPTGGLLAQANWPGPKVGGHWRCFFIYCMNRVNSHSALVVHWRFGNTYYPSNINYVTND